jgi:single-stranded DNA-binding protein
MENIVKIQGIIQPGYKEKPAVYQLETANGWYLTKFQIKHTDNGRSMFIQVVRWGTTAPALTLAAGMEIIVTGKLGMDSYEKDGVKQYRLAVAPNSIQIVDTKPTSQSAPAPAPAPTEPAFDHDIPPLPQTDASDEQIPF